MAPDDTTRMSRFLPCSAARSAASEVSHASLSLPAFASTNSDEPTFTTMRRKSSRCGVFMAATIGGLRGNPRQQCLFWLSRRRRAHLDPGALLDRLDHLGDIALGPEFVAGQLQQRGDRLDGADRHTE